MTNGHPSDVQFLGDSILEADPVGADGAPLAPLHDREYRVRAYRLAADRVLLRGAVRDQKPPHLYFAEDDRPLTVHHMQLDLEVRYPDLEIVAVDVRFQAHPHQECPSIVQHYQRLVGLSIARGFAHRVRELFGGPRACTHTTALLQAMAPVAVQTIWSLRAADGGPGRAESADGSRRGEGEGSSDMWKMNVGSCHVWAEDGPAVGAILAGRLPDPPEFARERMVELGLDPEAFHRRMS
ncbi:MAG: DUF2889 domain-containing protein [Actinomycetota bacterium]